MNGKHPANKELSSNWQLLAEFVPGEQADSEQILANQVAAIGRRLRTQPELVDAILKVMERALSRATTSANMRPDRQAVRIRIWASASRDTDCGWGFFLVDKHDSALASARVEEGHLLELFLYQVCP